MTRAWLNLIATFFSKSGPFCLFFFTVGIEPKAVILSYSLSTNVCMDGWIHICMYVFLREHLDKLPTLTSNLWFLHLLNSQDYRLVLLWQDPIILYVFQLLLVITDLQYILISLFLNTLIQSSNRMLAFLKVNSAQSATGLLVKNLVIFLEYTLLMQRLSCPKWCFVWKLIQISWILIPLSRNSRKYLNMCFEKV